MAPCGLRCLLGTAAAGVRQLGQGDAELAGDVVEPGIGEFGAAVVGPAADGVPVGTGGHQHQVHPAAVGAGGQVVGAQHTRLAQLAGQGVAAEVEQWRGLV
ncbi:hypothetical protein AOG27_20910, partial [Pseudoalteromonas lipolytica]